MWPTERLCGIERLNAQTIAELMGEKKCLTPQAAGPGPWLRGDELKAVMSTLKAGDVVEVDCRGYTATGKLWAHSPSGLSLWSSIVRTSNGNPGGCIDALRIIERAPEPEPGADIPNEVVEAALAAIPWASDHQLADVRAALAAADAKRAELEGQA